MLCTGQYHRPMHSTDISLLEREMTSLQDVNPSLSELWSWASCPWLFVMTKTLEQFRSNKISIKFLFNLYFTLSTSIDPSIPSDRQVIYVLNQYSMLKSSTLSTSFWVNYNVLSGHKIINPISSPLSTHFGVYNCLITINMMTMVGKRAFWLSYK